MSTSFTIKDMNKQTYFLHFKHKLFWEIGFLEGTCAVVSRSGALTKHGDRIPDSIEEEEVKSHDSLLSAIQDVQARINKKIQYGGYTLEDDDVIPNFESTPSGSSSEPQINQKRPAVSHQGFDELAKQSLLKKLHALKTSSASGTSAESHRKINEENQSENMAENLEESAIISPQNEEQPVLNFTPEERKGAYLEKIEFGETLFYKIQISKNKLLFEEGKIGDSLKQSKTRIYLDYPEAQQKMEAFIKEKEKEGYKNNRKKFVYNFQAKVRGQKKSAASSTNAPRTTTHRQEKESIPRTSHNLQQNNQEKETKPCPVFQRKLRSQSERNYANDLKEALSYQTKTLFSFKPVDWPESEDPTGLILREKLNGVICVWDGKDKLTSRNRHAYKVPKEFIKGFPPVSLLGIVYLGPNSSYNVGMNMRSTNFQKWKPMKFVVYDILDTEFNFKERMETLEELLKEINSPYIEFCKYKECKSQEHFKEEQAIIKEKKGDGLLLNKPNGLGLSGVNSGLYAWNNYIFEEAEFLENIYDSDGTLKSFKVRHLKGNILKIHKGIGALTKEERPKIGDIIIYKTLQEKSLNVPKMPVFVQIKPSDETE